MTDVDKRFIIAYLEHIEQEIGEGRELVLGVPSAEYSHECCDDLRPIHCGTVNIPIRFRTKSDVNVN